MPALAPVVSPWPDWLLFGTGVLVGVGVDFGAPVAVLVVVELVDSVLLSGELVDLVVELVDDFGVGVGVRFGVEPDVELEVSLEVELEVELEVDLGVGVGVRLGVDLGGVDLGANLCIDIIVVGTKAVSTRTRGKILATFVLVPSTITSLVDVVASEAETTAAVEVSPSTAGLAILNFVDLFGITQRDETRCDDMTVLYSEVGIA
ncbi:hypothetical protein CDV36_012229 [Fusarium kuroshium]|uniref:Uncharacterized protein n=1 Tax=Fusarium kuroshium TaxID=2010991 RepID=A0A3M2RSP5_9HYPO|nr:hypothetical protein CDV36_012229 [Fusarium kuroshium]